MKYVDVHFEEGCKVGKVIAEVNDTVTVEFDDVIITDIPNEIVTDFVN